ncbi:Flp pilus assembly protein CpaB [Mesorhizobium sp. LHD-90]|uniref:Flp pilus assembly protein CpaB n=1 Tax=Mesorhizobium sp. LHD-90 TaxID=3071414 RepID=UPI0027DF5FA1|nr:Flp pilus assembly protein CpaB [Mesorhizobium sp. LHD-90]MDQ6435759.1 Flp pilus assembly protein CpaB [Mesorhizobium sp. LHD-90]
MAASRLIILGVAVAAAGGAGYVAKNMTAPQERVVIDQGPLQPVVETTQVLVVAGDVPMGANVGEQLSWQEWPSAGVNENFITRDADPEALEQFKSAIARVPIYAGEPLRKSKLVGEGQSFMSSILPSGYRAIATQISADTSAGGFILPNDYVDVIMTRRSENGSATGFITETILQNIKVLAIDQTIQEDEEGKKVKVGDTATLELTQQQAEIITVAQQMADRLTLALRSVADAQQASDQEADYLVTGSGKRGTIRLIKSGEVTEVGAKK